MRGVVYVVYGEAASCAARNSIHSLRSLYPDTPITVIGDNAPEGTSLVPFPERDRGGRWAKVNLDMLSPYDPTLYLDADTRVCRHLDAGWTALGDGWDMVIAPCSNQGRDWLWHVDGEERTATRDALGQVLALQGGMFFFRKNARVHALFEAWRAEWERWQRQDQAALLRALYANPVKIWLLGRPWNMPAPARGDTIIEHQFGRARG